MIFYFTATGNSKFVAEKVAESNERLINISDCIKEGKYNFDISEEEKIGVISPIYFYGIPLIVNEFLQKMKTNIKPKYTYVILNCGGSIANAEKLLKFKFDAYFDVRVVDNYVPMFKIVSEEKINNRLNGAESNLNGIAKHIQNQDKGSFTHKGPLPRLMTKLLYPLYKKGRKTKKFRVNTGCTSCGLCAKICPRQVIKIKEGKPIWVEKQCELCLACLHRCPVKAINYGKKTAKNGRYLNSRTLIK